MNIYILKLKHGKYYVGKTENPEKRIDDHFQGNGSTWTRKYKPLKIHKIIEKCDSFDEDKYTLIMMEKYGIENVRGGSFCSVKLPNEQINVIVSMIDNATDRCFNCGEKGHTINECEYETECESESSSEELCGRCGRDSHDIKHCYAKTDTNGRKLFQTK